MNSKMLESLKNQLLEEKKHLEEELSHFAHRNPNTPGVDYQANFPDIGNKDDENASEVAEYSDNLSLENSLEKSLRDTISSLKSIENGTYGICKYCEEPIDENRLHARPTSSSCIRCKKTLTQEM
jgi:RNA polymerase-binding protein DksA